MSSEILETEVSTTDPAANPDAITGAPGSHPIGTSIGAASAGAAGAMIGSVLPGIGTAIGGAIGAVVGAVAGGYAGKAVAETVNPTVEEDYWRQAHEGRPYIEQNYNYDTDYRPAYRYGWQSRGEYAGQSFDEAHLDLGRKWDRSRGQSRLEWEKAQHAARDAWNRIEERAAEVRNELRGNLSGTGLSAGTPPPLPGSVESTASGAKGDPSHRNTGTANVQTLR